MPEITPLDLILLRREEVSAHLNAHGLRNARVVGWAGARLDLPGPAEIEVDMPMVTDLTAGDLGRIGRDLTGLVGFEILVWPSPPGQRTILPGERVVYL